MRKIYYGWIVVASAFFIFCSNSLAIYGFGVFLTPLTEEFGWERGALSAAFSLGILVNGLLATVAGRLSDRYGPALPLAIASIAMAIGFVLMSRITSLWQAYLIWGVFLGIGIGGTVVPINTTIPRWFGTRMGMAVSIPIAGFGIGSVLSPLLTQWLINSYTWRTAFVILGVIRLVISLPFSFLVKRYPQNMEIGRYEESKPEENTRTYAISEGMPFREALKSRRFWLFAATHFGFGFCLQTIIVHIVPNAIDKGIPDVTAAGILSILAASGVIGTLSAGFFSNRIGNLRLLTISLVAFTISIAWLLITGEVWMFYLFAIIFGFFHGAAIPLWTISAAELFGMKSLGMIFGTVMMLGTIGGSIGAPMSGVIFDTTGNYNIAFIVGAGIGVFTILSSILLQRAKRR
ncbi:MFS transporter [Chloroflexota bacterium]